jgi:hypothetical protein
MQLLGNFCPVAKEKLVRLHLLLRAVVLCVGWYVWWFLPEENQNKTIATIYRAGMSKGWDRFSPVF